MLGSIDLTQIVTLLPSLKADGLIDDLINSHIVAGDWPEDKIRSRKTLRTLSGESLDTSMFPTMITMKSTGQTSSRSFRPIVSTTESGRRICFIDDVLISTSVQSMLQHAKKLAGLSPSPSPAPNTNANRNPPPASTGTGGAGTGGNSVGAESPNGSPSEAEATIPAELSLLRNSGEERRRRMLTVRDNRNRNHSLTKNTNRLTVSFPCGESSSSTCAFEETEQVLTMVASIFGVPDQLFSIPTSLLMGENTFSSVDDLLRSRADCVLFSAIVHYLPEVSEVIANHPTPLHLLVPTDEALWNILLLEFPSENLDVLKLAFDFNSMKKHVRNLSAKWRNMPDVPTLPDIILYHFVTDAGKPISELGGVQLETLADGVLTVTPDGKAVEDADKSRPPANVIASHAALNGFLSPIASVLTEFDVSLAKKIAQLVLDEYIAEQLGINGSLETGPFEDEDPTPIPSDDESCFPGDATLNMPDGTQVAMRDVNGGDVILVSSSTVRVGDGQGMLPSSSTSRIVAFTHRQRSGVHPFLQMEFDNGMTLTLSENHYTLVDGEHLVAAREVRVGQQMISASGDTLVVRKVKRVWKTGRYAPHSMHGDLVVDNVVVSAYTMAVCPWVAHALLVPVRLFAWVTGVREPLGSTFYHGANSRLMAWVPRGKGSYLH